METTEKFKKNSPKRKKAKPGTFSRRAVETVQSQIPILCCHEKENLIQSGEGEYSRTYRLGEINFETLSEEEQEITFARYCSILNSMGSNTRFAITLHNRAIDMASFEDSVLMKERGDGLDSIRRQMNKITLARVKEGKNGLCTDKFLTVSALASDPIEAKAVFERLDKDLNIAFQSIGSGALPLSMEERLDALYNCYNPGHVGELLTHTRMLDEEGSLRDVPAFDFDNLRAMGLCVNDIIAPSSIAWHNSYIEIGDKLARALSITDYPAKLSVDCLNRLCRKSYNILASVNVKPYSGAAADHLVGLNLAMVRAEKARAQQRALKDGASEDMISPEIVDRETEALKMRESMRKKDERLFAVCVTFVVYADTLRELDEYTQSLISYARGCGIVLQTMVGLQDLCFTASVPLCVNELKSARTCKSSTLAALNPFSLLDLSDPQELCYGVNDSTRNLVLYDRKSQFNANGFILGTSGSGKSFAAKTEMLNVLLKTDDDVIVLDPEAEYAPLCEAVGGEMIRIVPGGKDTINPMSVYVDHSGASQTDPVRDKADFILTLCNVIIKSAWGMDSIQETIIDECVHELFAPFYSEDENGDRILRDISEEEMPSLTDLCRKVTGRPEPEARDIAYALQLYTGTGSLNLFGGRTNVKISSRFVVFDINALGKKLMPVAMQILLDALWQRIVRNRALGRHTWIYIDEIYLLFRNEISASWLQQLWKRARKYGGVPTGITQNVEDLLASETARSMLSNSSFIYILNQAPTDLEHLRALLHLSGSQCERITDAPRGQGLIYTGTQTVPVYARFPKNNDVYRVLTSDMEEIRRYREEEYRRTHFEEPAGGETRRVLPLKP